MWNLIISVPDHCLSFYMAAACDCGSFWTFLLVSRTLRHIRKGK